MCEPTRSYCNHLVSLTGIRIEPSSSMISTVAIWSYPLSAIALLCAAVELRLPQYAVLHSTRVPSTSSTRSLMNSGRRWFYWADSPVEILTATLPLGSTPRAWNILTKDSGVISEVKYTGDWL